MSTRWWTRRWLLVAFGIWCQASAALAGQATSGGGMPWDDPIDTVTGSVTGKLAPALLMTACVIAGAVVAKSGDLGQFGRQVFTIILGGGFMIGAHSFIAMYTSGGLLL
jgi:type IV secretion system protein TrbC